MLVRALPELTPVLVRALPELMPVLVRALPVRRLCWFGLCLFEGCARYSLTPDPSPAERERGADGLAGGGDLPSHILGGNCTKTTKRPRNSGGFTILDTMVASFVMLVGTVGLLAMHLTQVHAGARARQLSEASSLLQQKTEELALLTLPQGDVQSPIEHLDARGCSKLERRGACAQDLPGTTYERSYRIVPLPSGRSRIEVVVGWVDPQGAPHRVSLIHER